MLHEELTNAAEPTHQRSRAPSSTPLLRICRRNFRPREMNYDTFVERVRQKTGLDRDHAEVAIQSVLSALGERLSEKEARDLASELPRELKPTLENVPGHGRRYRADDFVRLVGDRERVAEPAARLHTRAVLSTMSEAVSRGELADILAEMWADPEFDELWAEPEAASTGPPATASSEAQVS